MNKLYTVQLSDEQSSQLERLISAGTHKSRVLARARVLLLAQQGLSDAQIVQALQLGPATVARVRKHFVSEGFERALYGKVSPGRPIRITGEVEAKLVMLACSTPPAGRARWTLQLLAGKMVEFHYIDTISDQQVHNMLKKTGLSPGARSSGASPRPMLAS